MARYVRPAHRTRSSSLSSLHCHFARSARPSCLRPRRPHAPVALREPGFPKGLLCCVFLATLDADGDKDPSEDNFARPVRKGTLH